MLAGLMPTDEGDDLIDLVREIAAKELRPRVDAAEAAAATSATFPREVFATLGQAGLLSLPYPEEFGGGGQPYEVYLQVIEEIAIAWMSVAVGTSVHGLTCYPVATFGTRQQQADLLPEMLSGTTLGAYALSETQAGSDIAAMTTRATRGGSGAGTEAARAGEDAGATRGSAAYELSGRKAWISHAGHADFYTTFARTSGDGGRGVSCFVVAGDSAGLTFGNPERKMGLHCDTVREVRLDRVPVEAARRIGEEGQGMAIALSALDSGRGGREGGARDLQAQLQQRRNRERAPARR